MAHHHTKGLLQGLAFGILLIPNAILFAAEPVIRNLNIRGLQVGSEIILSLEGDSLGKSPDLLLPFPCKQERKPGATDKSVSFSVKVSDATAPGLYQLRVVSENGVSLPILIGVDRLHQAPFSPMVQTLPAALHGNLQGSQVLETRFSGKKGEALWIDVEAQRLGSKLRPVVHLFSPKKKQISWAWPKNSLFGDCRLGVTLPEEGEYTISLHDLEYAGGAPGFFRLKIGQWNFIDQVFPPMAGSNQAQVEFLGSNSEVVPMGNKPAGKPLPWPTKGNWSGLQPFLFESTLPGLVESRSEGKPQIIQKLPVGINGKISKPNEEDQYKVVCSPGEKIRFDLISDRLGSSLDCALIIRNEAGQELARAEDRPGSPDPFLEFTVPEKSQSILACVVESQGRNGANGIYHLTMEPSNRGASNNEWRLTTPAQSFSLGQSEKAIFPLWLDRKGFEGSVSLSLTGLKGEWFGPPKDIPPDMEGILLELNAPKESPPGLFAIQGKSSNGTTKETEIKNHPLEKSQPWLARELAYAPVKTQPLDFKVEWDNLSPAVGLVPTGKTTLPIKFSKTNPDTIIRVTLVCSQDAPLVNNQPDPNQAIRLEKQVEIPAKSVKGEAIVLTPANLKSNQYDITLKAELLSPNKQNVLAVSYAPIKRLPVKLPLLVLLEGNGKLETQVDPKTGIAFKLKGKVERREGLTGDVTLAFTGLPQGSRTDPLIVKNGVNDFIVNIVFPPNSTPGLFQGKLTASGVLDSKQPNARVNSKTVDLSLQVKPNPK